MNMFLVAVRQRVPLRHRPRPRDSAPATTGSLTQNRIVWHRPRITRDDGCYPWNLLSVFCIWCAMNSPTPSYRLFVGVDIAAASFAATWTQAGPPSERARSFAQTPDGFASFQAALASTGVEPEQTLIVLEATG